VGFELGPGFLRRAPDGWLPARAFPVQKRVYNWPSSAHLESSSLSVGLDVVWDVRIEGRQAYSFREERRTVPTWCMGKTFHGKRFYQVRVRGSKGLQTSVGVPARVNPENGHDMWIDWDAAYSEHVEAWNQMDRMEREKARRAGPIEGAVERVFNPFAGRLREGEEHLVEQSIAADKAREAEYMERTRPQREAQLAAMGFAPVGEDEQAEWNRRREEMDRIYHSGRPATATVVSREDAGRKLANIPVILITLDVHDGPAPGPIAYEHVWGPRHAKRYKPGKRIEIRVDPQDPSRITLAS
jgi:hypothetical protein